MTGTMTAAVLTGFGGPEVLQVRTVPVPQPGPGEVRIRVSAAAVNNTDVWTRQGAYGLPGQPEALAGWRGTVRFPRIQGGDIAGTVDAVGAGGDPGLEGRRVLVDPALYDRSGPDANPVGLLGSEADGGFAGYVVAAADRVHDVTGSPLSDEQLACLPVSYGTAMGMLERARITSGETVLVTGASGGVGLALVQLAAARGARVVASTSRAKSELVRRAGADEVIHRDDGDLAASVARAAPDGLDAVADVVGGDAVGSVLPALRDGGRWVIAGALGGAVIGLDLRRLYLHNIALIGSSMHTPAHFDRLAGIARTGSVQPRVAACHALTGIHAAQREFARGEHTGKIVVLP
ncbi:zinc-binding dehydrogenase [Pseudonocardia parietis]|uniref:NADPH:quinone reductase-like Zn-dependent oxidoreductase n=1 Tax=Pseudonocardia parietis TaxID=570936 RepID=A0ABS4VM10_9PSEU|nr:zinc-binding dehydrogenase [Pseudonocardia parietis]MBP2364954.1 NADPH:quinone reductase-like Zn-dependent oxidoreductase [Pseudonocardia parietis]